MTDTPPTDDKRELLALAERVEAATGADRELDFWIDVRITGTRHTDAELQADIDDVGIEGMIIPYAYTASLDAAMSLVPSGIPWSVNYPANDDGQRSCHGIRTKPSADVCGIFGRAATPALALTAASLRAIAGAMPDED